MLLEVLKRLLLEPNGASSICEEPSSPFGHTMCRPFMLRHGLATSPSPGILFSANATRGVLQLYPPLPCAHPHTIPLLPYSQARQKAVCEPLHICNTSSTIIHACTCTTLVLMAAFLSEECAELVALSAQAFSFDFLQRPHRKFVLCKCTVGQVVALSPNTAARVPF